MNITFLEKALRLPLFLVLVNLLGCVEPQGVIETPYLTDLPGTVSDGETEEYRISVGDEVEVRYSDRADMIQTLQVQPDGLIRPLYLSPLPAQGKTLDQLTAQFKETLANLSNTGQKPQYILSVGDVLSIHFVNNADMNQAVRIRPDGSVTLPFVRTMLAEGKTAEEFESELRECYAKYLKRPDLIVAVENFSSNLVRLGDKIIPAGLTKADPIVSLKTFSAPQVFIGGEVAKPGVITYRNHLTLLQAIIEAGGYKHTGELGSVIVLRKAADRGLVIRRNLAADLSENTTNDIPLKPMDVVIVPKTVIATIDQLVDQYLNQTTIFMRNSPFNFLYNLNPITSISSSGAVTSGNGGNP
ncbi:MAG: polysaccharide biosynthesis/export family protein [Gammaproteobacteria bacterium]